MTKRKTRVEKLPEEKLQERRIKDFIRRSTMSSADKLDWFVDDVKDSISRRRILTAKQFEEWEATDGTAVALGNLVWLIADDLLHSLGVVRVRTQYRKGK